MLQILHKHVVTTLQLITEENRRIHQIMTSFNNERDSSQNLLVDSHHSSSNTEQTFQRYSASDTLPTSLPLVTKPEGISFSKESL